MKLEQAKHNETKDWTMGELDQVLKNISKSKSNDPDGLNRSIFHLNCIGTILNCSLLTMFNRLKTEGLIPEFMKNATITTIPKKGSKLLLKNERGIFMLSSVRTIFMRLLYNSKYDIIDQNMSDSNVGSRKNKSCLNHIFIINGIIHETLSSKNNKPVTLQIYDYTQMFDSMSLEEAVSDLFDSGITDNTLSLLYEANKNIKVKVKTPYGLSAETTFEKIVLQGDTWGPIMASNQVDTFGKQLIEEEPEFIYKYKGYIPIGVLGMVDDIAGVSESGSKAVQLNSYINVKTAEKKLQFGPDKCHTLTIAHKSQTVFETDLFIDHWKETHNEQGHHEETFEGKVKMTNVTEQKYLGYVLSDNGSNMNNIMAKQNRAIGIKKDIQYLVKGLGKYTLEGGMIYLNSLLRSSILFAAETMYDTKEVEYRLIERIEEDLLQKIFKTGSGCPIFQLYLESGHIPARFAIKRMKVIFFKYIISQDEGSLMF